MAHVLNSNQLNWHAESRRFSEEASSLLLLPGLPMPQVIEVVSASTGATARFDLAEHVSHAGEITAWWYAPNPNCPNATLTDGIKVWND